MPVYSAFPLWQITQLVSRQAQDMKADSRREKESFPLGIRSFRLGATLTLALLLCATWASKASAQGQKFSPAEWHRKQGVFYLRQRDLQKALGHFRASVELE